VISYSTGVRADTGEVIDPKIEANVAKHLDKDITNTEEVSKVASSGTSKTKSAGIDKAGIYSDDSNRHIERAQEKSTEEAEDKETGSWKIKENDSSSEPSH
jgi:hypothetical protein